MSKSEDLRPLFAEYASGTISAAELRALEAALRDDPELRQRFIEYMTIDSALGDMAALSEAELTEFESAKPGSESKAADSSASPVTPRSSDRSTLACRVVAFLGALAATLLIAALLWFAIPSQQGQPAVATLLTQVDAVLLCDGQPSSGAELPAGEYRLERGLLHLQFDGGVMVFVEAPARFDAVSNKRVMLHGGRLSATVPPAGIGFTVETPGAEVVDFGTEFSVDVQGGASEVHVFDGLVRVHPGALNQRDVSRPVELQASQAVRITDGATEPEDISIATDRFIRTFVESKRRYARTIKQFSPVAFYRMAIRDQGLACVPEQYSGKVLTGAGKRPPHARGVFAGGSLRVLAGSAGRGGRVDVSPPLQTGKFTLTAFVYPEADAKGGIVATNIQGNRGNFTLKLTEKGFLQATVRSRGGDLVSVTGTAPLALESWRHIVVTVDDGQLCLYEDGGLVTSAPCLPVAGSKQDVLWFGTGADGARLWDGRIDEVALFDRTLSEAEVLQLYRSAQKEREKSE